MGRYFDFPTRDEPDRPITAHPSPNRENTSHTVNFLNFQFPRPKIFDFSPKTITTIIEIISNFTRYNKTFYLKILHRTRPNT